MILIQWYNVGNISGMHLNQWIYVNKIIFKTSINVTDNTLCYNGKSTTIFVNYRIWLTRPTILVKLHWLIVEMHLNQWIYVNKIIFKTSINVTDNTLFFLPFL
jgi:hypothetical protein